MTHRRGKPHGFFQRFQWGKFRGDSTAIRQLEKKEEREEISEETRELLQRGLEQSARGEVSSLGSFLEYADEIEDHIFEGGRCVFCGSNDLDVMLYGPVKCPTRDGQPYTYTTETGDPSVNHRVADIDEI